MPIDIDRFEEAEDLGDPPTSVRIVRFLLANDDAAYTRREIADAIGADPETVGTNLTRLKDRGLVRHREPYWALAADREHVVETVRERYGDVLGDELLADDGGEDTAAGASGSSSRGCENPGLHREAAEAFARRARSRIGDRVDALHLFGSVARGTERAGSDSDVDVLAVVADDADFAAVDDALLDAAYDVQLEFGVPVEVHSIRAGEFADRRERGEPFVRTVLEEGVPVGDGTGDGAAIDV